MRPYLSVSCSIFFPLNSPCRHAQEEKTKENSAEATVVKIRAVLPSIVKLDAGLASIPKVQHLSLSTNAIEKISNLQGLCITAGGLSLFFFFCPNAK